MIWLTSNEKLPNPLKAKDDVVALSLDLDINRLIEAYKNGIFPWYNENEPVMWWCPDPRFVLYPLELKISKSMSKLFKDNAFDVTFNQNFEALISACAIQKREGQEGTWLQPNLIAAFIELHKMGIAQSTEVWLDNRLVGGLYGIKMGSIYFGESMFHNENNASKYGFNYLVKSLLAEGVKLIDCQVYTKHLESLGARHISKSDFLKTIKKEII